MAMMTANDETTLEQAVAELSRYSAKPLVIEDDRRVYLVINNSSHGRLTSR